jgi:hypothetical protein
VFWSIIAQSQAPSHHIIMNSPNLIARETAIAQINFWTWLERRYVDELRQMTFTSPVRLEVKAMIEEFDARPASGIGQFQMML